MRALQERYGLDPWSAQTVDASVQRALGAGNLWNFSEFYSSADSAVQYIKLTGRSNGEQFLSGRRLRCRGPGHFAQFVFPNDLPSVETCRRFVLLGTKGYSRIGGVPRVDYLLPDGFLRVQGACLEFDTVVRLRYDALPGGSFARTAHGQIVPTSPTNFGGESGFILTSVSNQISPVNRRIA